MVRRDRVALHEPGFGPQKLSGQADARQGTTAAFSGLSVGPVRRAAVPDIPDVAGEELDVSSDLVAADQTLQTRLARLLSCAPKGWEPEKVVQCSPERFGLWINGPADRQVYINVTGGPYQVTFCRGRCSCDTWTFDDPESCWAKTRWCLE